jgi:cobaltochelatase CobN
MFNKKIIFCLFVILMAFSLSVNMAFAQDAGSDISLNEEIELDSSLSQLNAVDEIDNINEDISSSQQADYSNSISGDSIQTYERDSSDSNNQNMNDDLENCNALTSDSEGSASSSSISVDESLDSFYSIDDEVYLSSSSYDEASNDGSGKTIFLISDNPGTNVLDAASRLLFEEHPDLGSEVNIVVRSGQQVKEMSEEDFISLLSNADVFIGNGLAQMLMLF